MDLPQKKKFTESERAALAKKLDDDLDQFMEEMAARKVISYLNLCNRDIKSYIFSLIRKKNENRLISMTGAKRLINILHS